MHLQELAQHTPCMQDNMHNANCDLSALCCNFFVCKCFLLSSVTEDHPEVQAIVLATVEAAKPVRTTPPEMLPKILAKYIQEVYLKNLKHYNSINTGFF